MLKDINISNCEDKKDNDCDFEITLKEQSDEISNKSYKETISTNEVKQDPAIPQKTIEFKSCIFREKEKEESEGTLEKASTTSIKVNDILEVICEGDGLIHKAKVLELDNDKTNRYYIHYLDYEKRMDNWISDSHIIRKIPHSQSLDMVSIFVLL